MANYGGRFGGGSASSPDEVTDKTNATNGVV